MHACSTCTVHVATAQSFTCRKALTDPTAAAMVARASVSIKKRSGLILALKYEVVKTAKMEKKPSIQKLTDMFSCGMTQMSQVLKKQGHNNMKTMLLDNSVTLERG